MRALARKGAKDTGWAIAGEEKNPRQVHQQAKRENHIETHW
jgi:hypothetical protein